MNNLWLEIRFALRQLRKSPAFAMTAVLTLAFGIGATTAIFSIVEAVLLRPLPFADPIRLTMLSDVVEGVDYGDDAPGVTGPGVLTYMRSTTAFSSIGGYTPAPFELSGASEPASIEASRLTASLFPTLGVSPMIGRVFTQKEDEGRAQVAVLSYQTWHSRFHGDPNIVGQKILLDRTPYEIIGVMPKDFEFPLIPAQLNRTELWVPMSFTQNELAHGTSWSFYVLGRLKPNLTPAQAERDAVGAAHEIMRNFPPALSHRRIHPQVRLLSEYAVAQTRPLVRTLFFAVSVVLFIACANLAGLLLVRIIRRRREISVRLALGAKSADVIRQSLVEALVLSISGGLLGLAFAAVALRVGISFLPEALSRSRTIGLDWPVAFFALALALLTGLVCGLIPAFAAARTSVNDALKEGGRTGTSGAGHARLRSALVIAELAVALVLLTASGLLLRSFDRMRSVDLGFHSHHMLTASYSLPRQQYSTQAAIDAFNLSVQSKLGQLPAVQAAGFTSLLPAANQDVRNTFTPEGYSPSKEGGLNLVWAPEVSGDFFNAAGIRIVRGRAFTTADTADSQLVVIVNQKLAERYWPGQDPIGKRLHRGSAEATALPWITVIGEAADVKELAADVPTTNQMYLPVSQIKSGASPVAPPAMVAGNNGAIVVRATMPPEQLVDALRSVVRSVDPQLPLTHVESMDRVVAEQQASRRFNTAMISCFAAAAVLLSLIGIYSVIAFSAALRKQEMAIRLALGSQRSTILGLILASGAKLGLIGCGLGAVATVFATRLLRSMLFEVDPLDPAVIVIAAICILLLAVAASVIPARRAASIEPMQALRTE
jgi:putative ABC transport system permease protein